MNEQTDKRSKIYPNFRECSIQTFNDRSKEEHSQSRILPMTEENLEKCIKLQTMLPYGIYFSVNPMESWKRDMNSVKKIQTWICDIDDMDKSKQLELINNSKLKPSLVVESVHWFHLYYLAKNELTREEYESWNRWLKNYYNWDPKVCKDIARVLRIPWYYHMKWEPIMELFREDLSSGEYYTVEQMQEAFPNQSDTTPWRVKQREQLNKYLNDEDKFRTKAWELDSRMMLEELSWTSWLSWDLISFKRNTNGTEQIYCNGKSTWCWIDRNWYIGSSDKWWPTWIQWLKWYWLVDRKQLAEYLKIHHSEIDEKKIEKLNTEELIYNPTIVPKLEKPTFTRWELGIDDHIWKMKRGQLVILLWETWAWKTTFATFMARHNKNSCYYVLEDKVENITMRYAMKRAWITKHEYNEGSWSKEKEMLYERAYLDFRNRDIKMIDVWHKIKVETLMQSMKDMKEKWCWLFFIDNLWFIIGNWADETAQTAYISSKLVSFCIEEDVCIVLLHHFKKWKAWERDISQMRGSGKLWDDAFTIVKYIRDDEETFLQVYKDRTRWELGIYSLAYDKGEFKFTSVVV